MTINDILKLHGVEPKPELEKALHDFVKAESEEKIAGALAESGKDSIPKSRFDEVNETRKALKLQVDSLSKELSTANQKLLAAEPDLKDVTSLREQVGQRLAKDWEARAKLLDEKAADTIKTRVDAFRGELKTPAKGQQLTVDELRHNLAIFETAEKFGGSFDQAQGGTPPRDGTPPVKPAAPVGSPFAKAFEAFKS